MNLIIPTFRSSVQLFSIIHKNLNYSASRSLTVGQFVVEKERITRSKISAFANLCGDVNPIHTSKTSAQKHKSNFKDCVVHGAYLNSLVSKVIGTRLPGEGSVVINQTLNFPAPCYAEEEVLIRVTVKELRKIITLHFECSVHPSENSEEKKVVLFGEAKVLF